MAPLKHSEIIAHLRTEFEEKLKGGGFSWDKQGILHTFDRAVGATAFWYADVQLENPDEKTR